MSNYRNRPKGDYIQEAAWQDLYKLAERWQDNLKFQLYEIKFLERLIDTYFIKLLLQENLDELRELQIDLHQSKNQSLKLLEDIQMHLNYIAEMLIEPYKLDRSTFRVEHELLEDDVSEFTVNHKIIQFTVFKMTKDVLENEKPNFIWKYN
ncbi:hypothetical protein [Psychroserpens sp.]|uniref:hypothetical protein n=1 Tax=Psychroserpens sp. TaxID=2020870 RepID=UPI002B264773|nr:hypothetical protein [Psychroserpens sp.]